MPTEKPSRGAGSRASQEGEGHLPRSPLDAPLSGLVDAGLAAIVFVAPLFMGGRHPLGMLVYVGLVSMIAIAWAARQSLAREGRWSWTGAEILVVAAAALVVLQILPLPQAILARLSPRIGELLPLWSAEGNALVQLGTWSQISLVPDGTRGGLAILFAHGLLFLVVAQRIRRLEDIERLLAWIAWAAAGMALLGLLQYFAGNGKFLWFYEHPYRDTTTAAKGSFANENHFAHFLALGIGPLIWCIWRSRETGESADRHGFGGSRHDAARQIVGGIALAVVVVAALFSFSRGGVAVMVVAVAAAMALFARAKLLGTRALASAAGVAVLVVLALFVHGSDRLADEMSDLDAATLDQLDHNAGRRKIWEANLHAAPHFALVGAGIDAHRHVYPIHFEDPSPVEYTHAESGYLQVALEAGIPGLLLLLAGIGLCGTWIARALWTARGVRAAACAAAIAPGLVASVVHSVFDFVWYLPACMSLALILAACAGRLWRFARPQGSAAAPQFALPRWGWPAAAAVVVVISVGMLTNRAGPAMAAPHWERFLVHSLAASQSEFSPQAETADGGDADPRTADRAALATAHVLAGHLDRALRWNPNDARAHQRLAVVTLRIFEMTQRHATNAMDLAQVRDAAVASRFPSRAAQDQWLETALGREQLNRLEKSLSHARRAVQLCPLQGEAYVHLAELGFLEGQGPAAKEACIEQALRVRPHSGTVLLAAGREAVLAGDLARGLDLWKRSFRRGAEHQNRIIELLAAQMPAEVFVATFDPDLAGLRALFKKYRDSGRPDQAMAVAPNYVLRLEEEARLEQGRRGAWLWISASEVHEFLGDGPRAVACARKGVEMTPNNVKAHLALAARCMAQREYDEALEQLQWCLNRKPGDTRLQRLYQTALQKRSEAVRIPTAAREEGTSRF
jgi:O-antigen ligase/tetratricopeptide (TPR) repeat protein